MKLLKHKYLVALILFGVSFTSVGLSQPVFAANVCPPSASTDSQITAQRECISKFVTECKKTYKTAFCNDLTATQVNKCATGKGTNLKADCMKQLETTYKPTPTRSTSTDPGCSSLDPTCTPTDGDCSGDGTVESLNEENCGIISYIVIITNVLSALVGVIIVAMIIWGGIQYSTAGADASKVQAAKQKIVNALIALLLFVFGFAIVQWLIPGGLF